MLWIQNLLIDLLLCFLWLSSKAILLLLAISLGFGCRTQMFPSIFSARFLWLCVQSAWGCARVLPTSEALVPVHPELQCWPMKAPPPSPHYPDSESYSASAVFPRVCLMCAVRYSDCSEGSGWTGPHRALRCVDTVAYPEAWQQPLKRAPEKLQRNGSGPWCWPSSPFTSPWTGEAPALTAELSAQSQFHRFHPTGLYLQQDIDYLPAVRFTSLKPVLEQTATCDRSQSWGWSPEDVQTARAAHTDHRDFLLQQESIQVHVSRFHRALSPVKHNTQDQDHPSAEEALSISHTWRKVWVTASFQ